MLGAFGLDKNPQKFKSEQKWDSSMAVHYKTSVSHFKVKNTALKDIDEKGEFKRMLSFLLVDNGGLFFTK